MSDVNCPACGEGQYIIHDDGQGYEEEMEHEQDCTSCPETFKYFTSISYCYEVFCSGEHNMEQSITPGCSDMWSCEQCDYFEVRKERISEKE